MNLLGNLANAAGIGLTKGVQTLGSAIPGINGIVHIAAATNAPTAAVTSATGGKGWAAPFMGSPSPSGATSGNANTGQAVSPNNTSTINNGGSGGGSGASSGPSAAQLAANNQAIDLGQYNLGLLPQQLQNALGNVQHSFDQNNNQLQSGYNTAQQGYHQSTDQNGQQFVANKNTIANQASNGLHGILAQLAAHGAGGSSAAMYAAPDAVNHVAAQQRAGAGQTFGQNQQALDTNWGNYQTGFDNSKRQLADWLGQQRQSAESTNEGNRQDILRSLAGLQSNAAGAQPYIDQIKTSAQHVADLGNFNPSYTGTTPTYTAPDVASYTVNQTGAPVLGNQGNNTGAGTSFLQFLQNQKDKQQNQFGF